MTAPADTTGIKVGDPDPWSGGRYVCCPAIDEGYCTAPLGHSGPHIACGLTEVFAVWEQA